MQIWTNLTAVYPEKNIKFPLVHTYELYDKAFEFERVRKYDLSVENMDVLEQFEDNLNINPTNV